MHDVARSFHAGQRGLQQLKSAAFCLHHDFPFVVIFLRRWKTHVFPIFTDINKSYLYTICQIGEAT